MITKGKPTKRKIQDKGEYFYYLFFFVLVIVLLSVVCFKVYEYGGFAAVYLILRATGLGAVVWFLLVLSSSRWPSRLWMVGYWLALPVALPVLATFNRQWGIPTIGWILGFCAGSLVAVPIVVFQRRRYRRLYPSGPVLLVPRGERLTRPVSSRLTLTGFREALAVMDGDSQCVLSLVKGYARLNVFGDPSGRMVVYYTSDLEDESQWRRVSSPGVEGPEEEIEMPVGGGIMGSYRRVSTTTAEIARRAGEYFIRDGGLDPELVWDDSDDVFDRLPPTRLEPPLPPAGIRRKKKGDEKSGSARSRRTSRKDRAVDERAQ